MTTTARPGARMEGRQLGRVLAASGMFAVSLDSLLTRAADTSGVRVAFWFGLWMALTIGVVNAVMVKRSGRAADGLLQQARSMPGPLAQAAVTQAISSTLFVLAVKNTTVANVVVIIAAAPVLAAIASRVLIGERTTRRVWIAIAASIAGIVIVMSGSFGGGGIVGDLLAVGAITGWSLNLIVYRRHPTINRMAAVGGGGAIIALVMFAVLLGTSEPLSGVPFSTHAYLFLMGAVTAPLARVMIATAASYLPAAEVSLFGPIETLAATLWAWLAFAEEPPAATFVGGAIVIAAVIWGTRQPPGQRPVTSSAKSTTLSS